MKALLLAFALVAGPALAEPSSFHAGTAARAPVPPVLYSFADVYRLTVAGALAGQPFADGAPLRVATAPAPGVEPRFSITPPRQPGKWLLVVAGLALAGWVAHRRLAHGL
jgi:hypothetical protein